MIKDELKKIVLESLRSCLEGGIFKCEGFDIDNFDVNIQIPKNRGFGDFCTNVSSLARYFKINPEEIAQQIVQRIDSEYFEVCVVNSFINFGVRDDYLLKIVRDILKEKSGYSRNRISEGEKVLVEYVSANPTGPFHIGHGRWAAVGSALSNILRACGYDVYEEFYINDAGNQIKNLGNSLKIRILQQLGLSIDFDREGIDQKKYYTGEYLIDIAKDFIDKYPQKARELSVDLREEDLEFVSRFAKDSLFLLQKETLERFRTNFDNFFSEKSLNEDGEVELCLKMLEEKGMLYEKDGAVWFRSTYYREDDQDRVIKKRDGSYTYLTADIAYHYNKLKRGYNRLINIWGADHHGYIPRMRAAIRSLGYNGDSLEVLLGQLVNLVSCGDRLRMGKRSKMVTLEDLIEEVGVDATRYWMIFRSIDTTLDFDVELAKASSEDNPVFYVQYAYARACSIIRNAFDSDRYVDLNDNSVEKLIECIDSVDLSSLFKNRADNSKAYDVTKKLILKLEESKLNLISSAINRAPYLICKYVQELSALFHQFYNLNRVLSEDVELTKSRILLVSAFVEIMKFNLDLLKVSAPERM